MTTTRHEHLLHVPFGVRYDVLVLGGDAEITLVLCLPWPFSRLGVHPPSLNLPYPLPTFHAPSPGFRAIAYVILPQLDTDKHYHQARG